MGYGVQRTNAGGPTGCSQSLLSGISNRREGEGHALPPVQVFTWAGSKG